MVTRDVHSSVVLTLVDGIHHVADKLLDLSSKLEAGVHPEVTPMRLLLESAPFLLQLAKLEGQIRGLTALITPPIPWDDF